MPTEQEELIFDPSLISKDESVQEEVQEQKDEKLNLFQDPLFEGKDEDGEKTDEEKDKEKDTPAPDNIKDDEESSKESVFSVILGQELKDGGVLSSFDEEEIAKIEKEEGKGAAMKALLESQAKATTAEIKSAYDAEYQDYLSMLQGGVPKEEATQIQQLKNFSKSINDVDLKGEEDEAVQARKNLLTLDYRLNTKFSEEKIQKLVNKAYDEGSDLEDVDEAKERVDAYINDEEKNAIDAAAKATKDREDAQRRQTEDLTSFVDKTEEYFKGEKVTKQVREKMKKLLTTPVKLDNGTVTSELWSERDKDPVKFDAGIAYLKAIGFFDGKPLDKFEKKAKTKATSELDNFLNDNQGRDFMKSSNRSFTKETADKKSFLDF